MNQWIGFAGTILTGKPSNISHETYGVLPIKISLKTHISINGFSLKTTHRSMVQSMDGSIFPMKSVFFSQSID